MQLIGIGNRLAMSGVIVLAVSVSAFSQTAADTTSRGSENRDEVFLLKQQVAAQEKQISVQQKQIEQLSTTVGEMKQRLDETVKSAPTAQPQTPSLGEVASTTPVLSAAKIAPAGAAAVPVASPSAPSGGEMASVPAVPRTVDVKTPADGVKAPQNQEMPSNQQPLPPEEEKVEEQLERGTEIADVTPTTPKIQLGPAAIRFIGYPALTTVYRSTNSGGGGGTSFTSLPFDNTVPGNTSEFRLSPQDTRFAIRVDADLKGAKAAGYFEMDFGGVTGGNVAVSGTTYGFRIRQAWFDYSKGKFEIAGGQLYSLMTPELTSIRPWPADAATTQVIDGSYVAGLVWGWYPQVRLVYHASQAASFGFSIENPEQQVLSGSASGLVFPAALASTLNTQYNVGTNGLAVPNTTPDFVVKGSFDGKPGGHAVHLDVGGLLRVFRNYAPYSGNGVSDHNYAVGGGGNANFSVEITKGLRLVLDGFASSGAGRYIGGLMPDVIVRANGEISPITSYSWVSGFEIAPNKTTGLYAYFSGAYGRRNTAIDSDGSYIGWGYPGDSNAADRVIEEATGGYSRVLWSHEYYGSVQFGIQYAYAWLQPWVAGTGPKQANANMVFTQVRYNLP